MQMTNEQIAIHQGDMPSTIFSFFFPATMSGLKPIMEKLRAVFDKYASQDGDKNTVSKKAVRGLLSNEMLGEVSKKTEFYYCNMELWLSLSCLWTFMISLKLLICLSLDLIKGGGRNLPGGTGQWWGWCSWLQGVCDIHGRSCLGRWWRLKCFELFAS